MYSPRSKFPAKQNQRNIERLREHRRLRELERDVSRKAAVHSLSRLGEDCGDVTVVGSNVSPKRGSKKRGRRNSTERSVIDLTCEEDFSSDLRQPEEKERERETIDLTSSFIKEDEDEDWWCNEGGDSMMSSDEQ